MVVHWYIRVSDGINFKNSSKFNIYGTKSWYSNSKHFINNAKTGDIIWLVTDYKHSNVVIACVKYKLCKKRMIGPLVNLDKTNSELGWNKGEWDTEIHYTDLYNIEKCNFRITYLPNMCSIGRIKDIDRIKELDNEYSNITKYCNISFSF